MKTEIVNALIGASFFGIFLLFGIIALFFPPKKINSFYGYRTPRSMQSIENWKIANSYFPKVWIISTIISSAVYYSFLFTVGFSTDSIVLISLFFILPPAIITIILTERKLKELN